MTEAHGSSLTKFGGWAPILVLSGGMAVLVTLAFSQSYSWTHPELLGTSVYVWNNPAAGLGDMLRKTFDWAAFDPNVNRVRPLNDFAEVVDAIARPYLVQVLGTSTVALPSTLLTIILAPLLLYGIARHYGCSRFAAVSIALIAVLSTGFLSVVVAYIRPAKKLNILLLLAMLFYLSRFATRDGKGGNSDFWKGFLCCAASMFADEQALFNWLILLAFYFRTILGRGAAQSAAALSVPAIFFFGAGYVLPAIYRLYSVHGDWSALSDSKKYSVFGYLLDPAFYHASIVALGRSVLSFFGIIWHQPILVYGTVLAVLAVPVVLAVRMRTPDSVQWLIATVVLAGASTFMTLLDWYPFPYEVSYLGSFNYYYHSGLVGPLFLWVLFGTVALRPYVKETGRHLVRPVAGVLTATCLIASLYGFGVVNDLVRLLHFQPYDPVGILQALDDAPDDGAFTIQAEAASVDAQFDSALNRLTLGGMVPDPGFGPVYKMISKTPIMTGGHFSHLVRSFYPWRSMTVSIEADDP